MSKRMRPEERKALLLKTASKLFEANGFENVRVEDILHAANLSKGGFYHHFASKDDILRQLIDQDVANMVSRVDRLIKDSPLQALKALFQFGSQFLQAGPGVEQTISTSDAKILFVQALEDALDHHLKPVLNRIIAGGVEQKLFKPVDAETTVELFIAVNNHANRGPLLHGWTEKCSSKFGAAGIALLGTHLGVAEELAELSMQFNTTFRTKTS